MNRKFTKTALFCRILCNNINTFTVTFDQIKAAVGGFGKTLTYMNSKLCN